jgi:hypothetical protein
VMRQNAAVQLASYHRAAAAQLAFATLNLHFYWDLEDFNIS